MAETITFEKLKELIAGEVVSAIEANGLVKLAELKDHINDTLKPYVKQEDIKKFDEALEKLENLPGPDGKVHVDPSKDAEVGLSKSGGYRYFAEFAKDVFRADQQGTRPSAKFTKWLEDIGKVNETLKAAGSPTMEIGDPEAGGYLTPAEFSASLLEKGFENSNFIERTTKVPMAINQIGIPFVKDFDHTSYVHGAMMAYWLDELEGKTASKPKLGKINLKLNKLVVMTFASDELLQDSVISLEPLLRTKAAETIGWKVDEAIIRGTGAGQPLGIAVAGNPAKIAQAKETGQAATSIVAENIIKMYSVMFPRCLPKAEWVANSNTIPQLFTMYLAVGTGGVPVYMPANGLSGLPYDSLYGKRLTFTEHASTLGTEGDIMFVDFSQYLVGQKVGVGAGIQYASSIHLKFDYDQTAFRFVFRMDGQPWWPTKYTPKRGSDQSPFITLATRS